MGGGGGGGCVGGWEEKCNQKASNYRSIKMKANERILE